MAAAKRPSLLADRNGVWIEARGHVRITHPRHSCSGATGTIVRIDPSKRKVWIALPDGRTVPANHRSVEVLL